MSADARVGLGIALMAATMLVLAVQDGFSRHLAGEYSVWMVVAIRYWFFAALAVALALRRPGGLRAAFGSRRPGLQLFRGLIMAAEICVLVGAFVVVGLTEAHAIFAVCPLIVVALSGPVLGERIGPARWAAVAAGFGGVLVMLRPGGGAVGWGALIPVLAAAMFATYAVTTRLVARDDAAFTSFLWTGVVGAVAMTPLGLWAWEPMTPRDGALMGALCAVAALAQYLFIRTYEVAEASLLQPFAYLQLVFAAAIGIAVFGETLRAEVALGAAIVVGAGVFAALRARRRPR